MHFYVYFIINVEEPKFENCIVNPNWPVPVPLATKTGDALVFIYVEVTPLPS